MPKTPSFNQYGSVWWHTLNFGSTIKDLIKENGRVVTFTISQFQGLRFDPLEFHIIHVGFLCMLLISYLPLGKE